jgi:DNA-binding response OmpR family regulator
VRILLVEDEPGIARFICQGLREEGYAVDWAQDGSDGLSRALSREYDLILLDILLPKMNGMQVLTELRREKSQVPVLLLTALDEIENRVRGLDTGADDYLVKPFDLAELLARLRALLRRHNVGEGEGAVLRFEDLTLNPQTRQVHRGTRGIELTKIEFDLLELFLQHPRQVLTRDQILDLVWGYNFDSGTNSLAVYIGYLRRKLEEGNEPRLIQTVRGVGYALRTS